MKFDRVTCLPDDSRRSPDRLFFWFSLRKFSRWRMNGNGRRCRLPLLHRFGVSGGGLVLLLDPRDLIVLAGLSRHRGRCLPYLYLRVRKIIHADECCYVVPPICSVVEIANVRAIRSRAFYFHASFELIIQGSFYGSKMFQIVRCVGDSRRARSCDLLEPRNPHVHLNARLWARTTCATGVEYVNRSGNYTTSSFLSRPPRAHRSISYIKQVCIIRD